MPLNLPPFSLDADPESVKKAREWVRNVLDQLERQDIVNAAELGVSELVTNAILHGNPPISVRVRGTRDHPRVEVRDGAKRPPAVDTQMVDHQSLLLTFGRGLGLVALHSKAWGAELLPEGKVVWFEPAAEVRAHGALNGEVFDLDQTVQQRIATMEHLGKPVHVRILDLPVAPYAKFRQRYFELSRELRLLALAHGHDYPVARELSEAFLQTEQERRLVHGREQLEAALAGNRDRVDLDFVVPATMPATMGRLLTALEKADQFCREQRLLVLAASPQQLALQRWWCSEFVRQGAGEEPTPWTGSFTVEEDPAPS